MSVLDIKDDLQWVINTYFSNPQRFIHLKKGEWLLREGESNRRLFYIRDGFFSGIVRDKDNQSREIFRAEAGAFLGLHSFFSGSFKSISDVRALRPAEVAYIERSDTPVPYQGRRTFEEQFMPIVILEMLKRQHNELELFKEKELALKHLIEREKLASLGQMAAGIAHELNNAVAVIYSSTNWLTEKIGLCWQDDQQTAIFEAGLLGGRHLSSREKRELQQMWQSKYKLNAVTARALAQTGLPEKKILSLTDNPGRDTARISTLWEIGATLNDMRLAAQQSSHVVRSVKLLGARHDERTENVNLNETIENTITLLHQPLKSIEVNLELQMLLPVRGNSGEFIQVWSNLIRNAVEAMQNAGIQQPALLIRSMMRKNSIVVAIQDNGPGIPENIREDVFNPNVTTKVSGMSFGLGLGLTIVQRIVHSYNGRIRFETADSGTTFYVTLPVR